ncbi:MAG: hypothetical protein K5860_10525 [Bacteroidales bacterium]|nr:hypothetical protein [Bacteroidales bacterium]
MIGNNPFRVHAIKIKWSNPICWENVRQFNKDWEGGFYYITRIIHKKNKDYETPIYIGKTKGKISKRILQHHSQESNKPFLNEYGDFRVRFGSIIFPVNYQKVYHYNRLLLTIESALITEVKPKCNCSQVESYTRWYLLKIISEGKRGSIPAEIDNRTHKNIIKTPSWWQGDIEE